MVRQGLFMLLGVVVVAAGPLPGAARMAMPAIRGRTPGPGTANAAGRSRSTAGAKGRACGGSGKGAWFSAAARRSAHSGGRDRETLSHGEATELLADLRRVLVAKFGDSDEMRLQRRLPSRIVIPVRFHVISSGDQGKVPPAGVQDQIATLNAAYGGLTGGADTGVSFRLVGTDYTDNDVWFNHPQQSERAIKAALHVGGAGTLNLYTAAAGSDVLGFSTFPQWYKTQPALDGVLVDYRSLPGGEFPHFDRGYTAVHETGHWLGLFHTFENGCEPPGDGVDDTPYEAVPTEGCPWIKNTCWEPGDDPIHNYMDYGYDDCMSQFTAGQARRIHAVWAAFRSGVVWMAARRGQTRPPKHTARETP